MKIFSYLFILVLVLSSCKSIEDSIAENFKDAYEVVELNGKDLKTKGVTFNIDTVNKRVSGNSGCNTYSGSYSISDDNSISFGPVMLTKMYCTEQEKNDIESMFTKALTKTYSFAFKKDQIQLVNKDNSEEKIILKRKSVTSNL